MYENYEASSIPCYNIREFIRILKIEKFLSKRRLRDEKVEYSDLGKYNGKTKGPRYLFYNLKLINNKVEYCFKDSSSIDLDKYVKFYLFIARDEFLSFIRKV